MIRKLNSHAVRSIVYDYTVDKDHADVTGELVKRGYIAAFLVTAGTSYNKVVAYIKRRFPGIWNDYVAVAESPSPYDFLTESSKKGIIWQELRGPESTLWLVDLDD